MFLIKNKAAKRHGDKFLTWPCFYVNLTNVTSTIVAWLALTRVLSCYSLQTPAGAVKAATAKYYKISKAKDIESEKYTRCTTNLKQRTKAMH